MAGGNRSAAAKKAWITRRTGGKVSLNARGNRLVPRMVAGAGGRVKVYQTVSPPKMTAKQWTKKMSAGEVMLNGRPMRDFFTTRGTRRK